MRDPKADAIEMRDYLRQCARDKVEPSPGMIEWVPGILDALLRLAK